MQKKTCTLWLESSPGKKDYKPYKVNYGEILVFNSKLAHGTEVNKENYTRFSMDFRIIKKKNTKKIIPNHQKIILNLYLDSILLNLSNSL